MSRLHTLTVGDYIERNRERLVECFVEQAAEVGSARGLSRYEIIDTLPEFLSTLVAISRMGRRRHRERTKSRLEETHLSLRLRQGFTQEEVTSEYVLLGRLIAELWERRPVEEQPHAPDVQLLFDELGEAMERVAALFTGYTAEDRQREKLILRRLDALAPTTLRHDERLDDRLRPPVELIQEAVHADGAELLLVDEGGQHLEFAVATGPDVEWTTREPIPLEGDSFPASVSRSEEPLVELPEPSSALGFPTRMGLRLRPYGKLIGVLRIAFRRAQPINPETRRLFETLVEHFSGILDRALLFESVRTAEEAGRRMEIRYRLATQAVSEVVRDWDLQTDVVEWSAGRETLFGYIAEDLGPDILGWHERIHPDDRDRVVQSIHTFLNQEPMERWEEEYRFRHRNGHYVRVVDCGLVQRDENGKVVRMVGAMSDISVERTAARALQESEEHLRLALSAATLGTWDFDLVAGTGRWDERSRELYGLSTGEAVSWDTLLSRVHPEDRERTRNQFERALDPTGSGEYDIEYRTLGGAGHQARWVRATGRAFFEDRRPVRFIGTVQDVSERKAIQDALQRSEREFRTLSDAMPQLVFTTQPDGALEYVNWRLSEYIGNSIDRVLGLNWTDLLHPDERSAALSAWAQTLSTEESFEAEQHIRRSDGLYRWHLVRVVPTRNAQGQVHKWLGTSTDIDDLKRAEVELRQHAELRGQLIGIVSHDLRNPLNAILLSAQALLRTEELSDRQARSVARILTTSERAIRLTRDLLDFTRARLGGGIRIQRSSLDFHKAVRHVVEEVQIANPERRIEFRCTGSGQGVWDGDRLAQVVTNLANNAITYSPPDSVVRVETRGEDEDVYLAVHNHGEPIAPELMPQLFQPFRRGTGGDSAARSIGLGLFIVHVIVTAHGGTVDVRSTGNEGTTFTVRLPRGAD